MRPPDHPMRNYDPIVVFAHHAPQTVKRRGQSDSEYANTAKGLVGVESVFSAILLFQTLALSFRLIRLDKNHPRLAFAAFSLSSLTFFTSEVLSVAISAIIPKVFLDAGYTHTYYNLFIATSFLDPFKDILIIIALLLLLAHAQRGRQSEQKQQPGQSRASQTVFEVIGVLGLLVVTVGTTVTIGIIIHLTSPSKVGLLKLLDGFDHATIALGMVLAIHILVSAVILRVKLSRSGAPADKVRLV